VSITSTDVRSLNHWIDEATASYIADLWNTAYPGMRADLTKEIKRTTPFAEAADKNSDHWKGHVLRAKRTRRELAQLDNCTYRGCTRSPGGFSVSGALGVVSALVHMRAGHLAGPNDGNVFRLLAELSDSTAARHAELSATS
jgi:Tfp pilus assembly protein PilP